jgi:hypothetical protein
MHDDLLVAGDIFGEQAIRHSIDLSIELSVGVAFDCAAAILENEELAIAVERDPLLEKVADRPLSA